jgi:hypothetical protein
VEFAHLEEKKNSPEEGGKVQADPFLPLHASVYGIVTF